MESKQIRLGQKYSHRQAEEEKPLLGHITNHPERKDSHESNEKQKDQRNYHQEKDTSGPNKHSQLHPNNGNKAKGKYLKGLPNIGMTCYLNSVIQFLFAAEKFREKLILLSHQQLKAGVTILLGSIFLALKKKGESRIPNLLVQLTKVLNLALDVQDDALKVLTQILSRVKEQGQDVEYLFHIQKEIYCKCLEEPLILDSIFLSYKPAKCVGCNEELAEKIINQPQYLIMTGEVEHLFAAKDVREIRYEFASSIIYSGSMKSGHYMCIRVEKGTNYVYNDSHVSALQNSKLNRFHSKCLLYKKTQVEEDTCDEQTQFQKEIVQMDNSDKPSENIWRRTVRPLKEFWIKYKTQNTFSLIYFFIFGLLLTFLFTSNEAQGPNHKPTKLSTHQIAQPTKHGKDRYSLPVTTEKRKKQLGGKTKEKKKHLKRQ